MDGVRQTQRALVWHSLLDYTFGMSLSDIDVSPSALELLRRTAAERSDYIDLSSSNPTQHGYTFPPEILREAADGYWSTRRYAPDPHGSLRAREAIADYYSRREPPLELSPEQIFITASTSEAYSLLFSLLAVAGDNVLAPIPSYPLFGHLAAMHHIGLRHYALEYRPALKTQATYAGESAGLQEPPRWELDADALRDGRDARTRALMLISPHNPTGHVVGARLQSLAELGLPIIADEVFCEFPFAARTVPPVGALHPDATVFHLNGISKMFALPDLKLGWIAISGPRAREHVEPLELLNDTLLSANSLTQFMLPALFERGMAFVSAMRDRIRANLLVALSQLHASTWVRVAPPLGGTYLFPEIVDCDDDELLLEEMLAEGLFAHPGYFYDESRGCFLMISALLDQERLVEGLERLRRVLDGA